MMQWSVSTGPGGHDIDLGDFKLGDASDYGFSFHILLSSAKLHLVTTSFLSFSQ